MIDKIRRVVASLGIEDIALIYSGIGIFLFDALSNFCEEDGLAYAFSYASDISFLMVLFLLIIFGIRDIRCKGFLKRRLIVPIVGVTTLLLIIAAYAYMYHIDNELLDYLKGGDERLQEIHRCLENKELAGNERETLSKSYAETYYYAYGEIIDIEKEGGSTYLFDPYADYNSVTALEADQSDALRSGLYIFALLIIGLLVAFLSPVKKMKTKEVVKNVDEQ